MSFQMVVLKFSSRYIFAYAICVTDRRILF
jgi:hypothetical protein